MTQKKSIKIGIMGGTFDPIHNGHLVTAEEALVQFKLDKVIFVPAGQPPHKEVRKSLDSVERYLMTVIATASNPDFEVSKIEIDKEGPSYTIDTVREFREIYGDEAEIYFITGADAILEIITWRDAKKLAKMCKFIAATRPGYCLKKFKELHVIPNENKEPEPGKLKVYIMEIPALAISSTDIRHRVLHGYSIKYLMPEGVANYVLKRKFYR
ncbi:nicotinate-nucleotide adenylyltransferase [Candidatus Oleimmundimicrobium sp.]|uniref:nicotinate-nucleotide adenylyltransferase n=1 Tax=Candidatus Oleimmundimicrobium sp. TaxID=3060597 RepID=UPI00271B00B8|nr:nicotinate-nucleotide adenylyltransferase [Candidatus Oleimmundimicrobium sp.]MDO8886151.1 nicotinate-nucleotide adenylyltransferase [Candidatus Oleimmundimicrobium sp.]